MTKVISNIAQFEKLFRDYFVPLCHFCLKYTSGNLDDAKEIVHKVFIKVWEKYDTFPADANFKSYLYTSVNNHGLNFIRDHKKFVDIADTHHLQAAEEDSIETKELERSIEQALNMLPVKCREVFEHSRFDGMKYAEIAKKMNISIKTVEAQMSKALRILREHLGDYLLLVWIIYLIGLG